MSNKEKKDVAADTPNTIEEIVAATTIADVYKAAKNLDGVIKRTRLIESPFFSEISGNKVFIKPENFINMFISGSETEGVIQKLDNGSYGYSVIRGY